MSTSDNSILGLKMPTDPRWADLASISIGEIASCLTLEETNLPGSVTQLFASRLRTVRLCSSILGF